MQRSMLLRPCQMIVKNPLGFVTVLVMAVIVDQERLQVQGFYRDPLLLQPKRMCYICKKERPLPVANGRHYDRGLFEKDPFSSSDSEPSCLEQKIQSNEQQQHEEKAEGSFVGFLESRWEAADPWEIRSDATIVSCHTLARFLAYDMTTPIKTVPGYEVEDIIALLNTFTSCVVLASLWTIAGLVTRLFETTSEEGGSEDTAWGRLVQTTTLAAPPWLILEYIFGWPTFESSNGAERIFLGSLGLLATMSLARLVSSKVLPRI